MKVYKTIRGIVIEHEDQHFIVQSDNWDTFINDDDLYSKVKKLVKSMRPDPKGEHLVKYELQVPMNKQELWACGVTYLRSKTGRQEESKDTGGGDFYAKVYEADRPEVFFKANLHRVVPSGGKVNIRKDSTWDVPEPELTLVLTSSGKIVGYTIGNDMSSRSIEGENPLYLPQAKTYDGCAAVGPCILVTEDSLSTTTEIQLQIYRSFNKVFEDRITISQIKRKFTELSDWLYKECSFPHGSLLMTGTGIVPPSNFTLDHGDEIRITIEPIGTLSNTVA
jgi:2-dehydro-3-deoxy-D-arabinonate dehydratase